MSQRALIGVRPGREPSRTARLSRALGRLLLAAVVLCACQRELTRKHQMLAQALKAPYSRLCTLDPKEGGGCNGPCAVWASATRAHVYSSASTELVGLPRLMDPQTDVLSARTRERARAVEALLGDACPESIERMTEPPAGDEALGQVERCSQAAASAASAIADLVKALDDLEADIKTRSGVELPARAFPCAEH